LVDYIVRVAQTAARRLAASLIPAGSQTLEEGA